MAAHAYSEIFLHFTWHTAENQPMLTGNVEAWVHDYLKNCCRQTSGVYFDDVGGTSDHIHLVARIEPQILISDFVQKLKGASSHDANEHFQSKVLQWQRGYGVVSFGRRNLPWVKEYVQNQRMHHTEETTVERLEAVAEMDDVVREESAEYGACPI